LTHTKMVVEQMVGLDEYKNSGAEDKLILFLTALLHDIAKPKRTRVEDGRIVSVGHAVKGAVMAREFLWKVIGLAGSEEERNVREAVSFLIRYHAFPIYASKKSNAERRMLEIGANGNLCKGFSLLKLYVLEKADVLGRISADKGEQLDALEYFKMLGEDLGCFREPYAFTSPFSQRAYFKGKTDWQGDSLFDSTWGEVILLSGLPGTGKDTFIENNFSNLPVVSLDAIRRRLKIDPKDPQGAVIATAQEEAKEYLRKKQPFVWNATNVTSQTRGKEIDLFERYDARVRTIFLETEWTENLTRNSSRTNSVPTVELEKMLSKLETPEVKECQSVEWIIT
ncbi:MAG: AAA family ATPase, partial [Clostridia bacterium]|nr:AAA family ATPase [Clostridia bacterium]